MDKENIYKISISNNQLLLDIKDRVEKKIPSSIIRKSDGENVVIGYKNVKGIRLIKYLKKLRHFNISYFNISFQKFFRKEVNCWHIINDDSTQYYAILDNVKGKSLPITFLTIFDENKQVYDSEIIKYREGYGGEVANKSWLNQFINYTDSSNYNVGGAISGISGATISVNSVSKGIYKLSILIDYIITDFDEKI